jgi:alkyl hydroperoxide reductase subunit AhpC
MGILQTGDLAPDFDVPALIGGVKRRFRLSSQKGNKNVLLAFYPSNWTAVSTTQLASYQAGQDQLAACHAQAVSLCVDSIMNTTAWEREIGPFDFPMCADFWPHGEVSRLYGVLREQEPMTGASERAIIVVDKNGKLAFRRIYGLEERLDLSESLQVLRAL